MARLPEPGADNGKWGAVLNDYLSQAHNANGTIKSGAVSKSAVGLGNVDDTSDANKPVSTATQTALDTKLASTDLDARTAAYAVDEDTALGAALPTKFAKIDSIPTYRTLDDWATSGTGHYLHGVSSLNGLNLDPAGTLRAVENAILLHPNDVVMIDLDYRITSDGALASIHDATTANINSSINVAVADTAFRDLPPVSQPKLYGVGTTDEPLGMIETILAQARGRTVFSIEVKDGSSGVPDAVAVSHRLGMADKIVWNTGDPAVASALTNAGLRAFMFNCNTTAKLDQAAAAGAWMVDVPTDASTGFIDYAISKGFSRIIRGFIKTDGTPQVTDAFASVAGMDSRLHGYSSDATGYLDRPGGATARSRKSIAGSVRTGRRGPGWRLVNSSSISDWLVPGRLYTYKAGAVVYTFGDLAGTVATSGSITIKMVFDTLPSPTTQSTRFKLFSPTENPANASANTVEGYVLGIQADGTIFLNSVPVGGGSPGSVISNIASTALVAGTEYSIKVEWDDTIPGTKKIRVTRVDTANTSGWVTEGARAIWRGMYHSAYTSQTTGVGAITDFTIA